ncbi:Alpha/beta hydrolase family protein [Gemmata obscuriglobus]|uniref:alpha/beta hydrolase family esterase n=1 Tax=Gemmata obscuriglobus TaxID=114 RepID=UPI00016C4C51|nr:LpqC [Gemmata obscuriglobus]QEG25536.1 Alpha/beta hydrolase family protein [Gemmata obscuriglobus]VTR98878.1 Poly(3-hydroxybutyrate) depolymerase-like protein OS=Kosmotoga olearia (strain TBF 19.5.1) GN=Kole_0508 PE=4 SV=1: Abhydrolase_5 [Gemmata obscuriglobus UQM 2246]
MVFLTGTGGTAEWADRETGWSELARQEGFALAVPEALPPDPAAPPTFLTNPPRWNDGSPPLFQQPQQNDVEFLTAVIDDAAVRYEVDPRHVFVTGFSNGAGMAFRLAAEAADRVAAIAPVAGYCWVGDLQLLRPVPTLYTVGTRDLLIPLRGGDVRLPWNQRLVRRPPVTDTLERWAQALGCAAAPVVRSDDPAVRVDTYPGPVTFDAVTIEGLGHHWPGGRALLNPRLAGPPSTAVRATEMIWEFFRRSMLGA